MEGLNGGQKLRLRLNEEWWYRWPDSDTLITGYTFRSLRIGNFWTFSLVGVGDATLLIHVYYYGGRERKSGHSEDLLITTT